jgi:hypothetical protein
MFGPIYKLLRMGMRYVMLLPSCCGRLARLWQPAADVVPAEHGSHWPSESAGADHNSLYEGFACHEVRVAIEGQQYNCECWLPVATEGTFDWFVEGVTKSYHAALAVHRAKDAHS